jgi:hypothetical protein
MMMYESWRHDVSSGRGEPQVAKLARKVESDVAISLYVDELLAEAAIKLY